MSPTLVITVALFVAGLAASVLAYWVRRNDATTAATLEEVRSLSRKVDKVHQTVFGPNDDNGLNGDNSSHKKRLHRVDNFINAVCLFFGLDCDETGAVRYRTDESPFERRIADRRSGIDRRRAVE